MTQTTARPSTASISRRRHVGWAIAVSLAFVFLVFVTSAWRAVREPRDPPSPPLVVNDVTQLNPIRVREIIAPTTIDEIVQAVARHPGPVSIGGTRHSMGGQIATEGGIHIDMRRFTRILDFQPERKEITVQAGARWRQIQERIDPANLSIKVMQSYADFTVGGSLAVNAHGRYVGTGPLISSVKSLKMVLADGSILEASRTQDRDVFNAVIGGYGGLGVIVEATLELTDNIKIQRSDQTMGANQYRSYFAETVRGSAAVFHSAILYPDDFTVVRSVTHVPTDAPLTITNRLIAADQSYKAHRLAFWIISEWPFGHGIRRFVIDPLYFRGEPVTWRNYEASYDVDELEPSSRATATYALQEYFVPVNRFDEFVTMMRRTVREHDANVINVTVRHTMPDTESVLSWAPTERFAFVIYYKQDVTEEAKRSVAAWTRALIDAALNLGGTFYLPYQLHATSEQFRRGYGRFPEYIALKRRLDPQNKFRNKLLDKYSHPMQ